MSETTTPKKLQRYERVSTVEANKAINRAMGIDEYGRGFLWREEDAVKAREVLENWYNKLLESAMAQQSIANANHELFDPVVAVLKAIGFQTTTGYGKKEKYAKWYDLLTDEYAKIVHQGAFTGKRWLDEWKQNWTKEIDKAVEAMRQKTLDAHAKNKRSEDMAKHAVKVYKLAVKYKVENPDEADDYTIMEAIEATSPFLELAVEMCRTRNQFDNGTDGILSALGNIPDTPENQLLIKSISSACAKFDGDGRTFRDIAFNYNRIVEDHKLGEAWSDYWSIAKDDVDF